MEVKQGYKQSEIGVIPSDWEAICFTDCATLKHGFQFRDEHFVRTGIPVTKIGNLVDGGGVDLKNATYVSENQLKYFQNIIIENGDVLMALTGATLGKVSTYNQNQITFQNYRVGNFIPKNNVSKKYIAYILQSKYIQRTIKKLVNEAAQPNLGKGDFDKFKIPLPQTTAEQTAIATALSDADSYIASLEKLIAKKRLIKQGAMQQLLKPKEGWVVKKFKDCCWFQEGPGLRNWQFTTQGMKVINVTNLENGYLNLDRTDRHISLEEFNKMYRHFEIDENDIVVASSGNSYAKVAVVRKQDLPLLMNTSVIRFKPLKNLSYNFLLVFLKSNKFKDQIDLLITGGAQPNFGPAHLNKIDISLPKTIEDQEEVATTFIDMDKEIEMLETKLQKAVQIKQGMMQQLLTGKIRLV